jgi:hypothetical protein
MSENCASKNYYDKKGCRISLERWEQLYEDKDYVLLSRDIFDSHIISTCWLGRDLYPDNDEPVIFNTCIIRPNGFMTLLYYTTEKVAINHHNLLTFLCDQECLEKFIEWRLRDDNQE